MNTYTVITLQEVNAQKCIFNVFHCHKRKIISLNAYQQGNDLLNYGTV